MRDSTAEINYAKEARSFRERTGYPSNHHVHPAACNHPEAPQSMRNAGAILQKMQLQLQQICIEETSKKKMSANHILDPPLWKTACLLQCLMRFDYPQQCTTETSVKATTNSIQENRFERLKPCTFVKQLPFSEWRYLNYRLGWCNWERIEDHGGRGVSKGWRQCVGYYCSRAEKRRFR